jgi:hypothetical protein
LQGEGVAACPYCLPPPRHLYRALGGPRFSLPSGFGFQEECA